MTSFLEGEKKSLKKKVRVFMETNGEVKQEN